MRKICICIALIVACALSCAALGEGSILTVKGTGVVNLNADTASVRLGVREVSSDVVTAQSQAGEKLRNVVDRLLSLGIDAGDIQTSEIYIYPNYDYEDVNNSIIGYTAENTIAVSTRDIDNIGACIDAAFEAGANTFGEITFSAASTDAEYDQALALAVQNAERKARVLAEAAGMELGELLSVSESDYSYAEPGALYDRAEAADAGSGTPIYASQLRISATVILQFSLDTVD